MKQILLSLLLAVITATAFAQVCPITTTFTSSEEGTGLTTFDYEFTGLAGRTYTFTTVEVDFDDGNGYQTIPEGDLSGDLTGVGGTGTVSGTIVWDGAASFPNRYHEQTKIRIKAQHFISGDGVTDIDDNFYPTVIIGDQEWMAKNLRVTRYNNENYIPTELSDEDWENTTDGAYAIYAHGDIDGLNSNEEVLEAYGALYNWYAVETGNLCPAGWSVPSDAEWTQLVDYVVAQGYPNEELNPDGAGNALKSCLQEDSGSTLECCDTSVHPRWNSDATHQGFDEVGFSALPGGFRYSNGLYYYVGSNGYWWSSSEHLSESSLAWYRFMISDNGDVERYGDLKAIGVSVRCIKDDRQLDH